MGKLTDGVKVADVVWASADFIAEFGYSNPYTKAPELCIEIVSPSYSKQEMEQKTDLYLARGAQEIWIAHKNANIEIFTNTGQQSKSKFFDTVITNRATAVEIMKNSPPAKKQTWDDFFDTPSVLIKTS